LIHFYKRRRKKKCQRTDHPLIHPRLVIHNSLDIHSNSPDIHNNSPDIHSNSPDIPSNNPSLPSTRLIVLLTLREWRSTILRKV